MSKKTKAKGSAGRTPAVPTLARGAELLESGRLTEAEATCRALLETNADDADALHLLGLVLAKRGSVDAGREQLERALAIRPAYPACRQNLGFMLMESDPTRAEECLRRVVEEVPNAVVAHRNLATLAQKRGDLAAAAKSLEAVVRFRPLDEEALRALAQIYQDLRDHRAELANGLVLLRLAPHDKRLRQAVSNAYYLVFDSLWFDMQESNRAEAVRLVREWYAFDPKHALARHMFGALTGKDVADKASAEYVTTHFDHFAPEFDKVLTNLGYNAPEQVKDVLTRLYPSPQHDLDIVDIGAGTGRLGPLVAPWKKTLIGVDLSSKMLERAVASGTYDETHVAEVVEFLASRTGAFDIAVCLDTLVYFGAIEELLEATFRSLRPGGRVFGTIELLDPTSSVGFKLHDRGRYSHTEKYLNDTLAKSGFTLGEATRNVLRKELRQDVLGLFFVAQRGD